MDIHTVYIIVHLIGVALGAGGAVMSDLMFFMAIKDRKISRTEMSFLELGSKMVWVGLSVLILSGVTLFLEDPSRYLESSKFVTKMIIVFVIFANGLVFHWRHLPTIHKYLGKYLHRSRSFMRNSKALVISGVVSLISWLATIILGSLRSIPYTTKEALTYYVIAIVVVSTIAVASRKRFFRK